MLDQRGRLLMAAVGFAGCAMPSYDRALWALRTWLDSWPGVGHGAAGGVGGVEEGGDGLTGSGRAPGSLELPRHEAARVEMVFVHFGGFTVLPELRLKFHLIPSQ